MLTEKNDLTVNFCIDDSCCIVDSTGIITLVSGVELSDDSFNTYMLTTFNVPTNELVELSIH